MVIGYNVRWTCTSGPGGGGSNNPDPNPNPGSGGSGDGGDDECYDCLPTEPIPGEEECTTSLCTLDTVLELYALEAGTRLWMSSQYRQALLSDVLDFIIYENDNSDESKLFSIEGMEAERNGGEVDFEDHLSDYDFGEESAEILVFEQDYRNRMSMTEKSIFDNLSRLQQLDYLHSAFLAEFYAKVYFEETVLVQYNGVGDAYRHALWNALGAAKLGENLMEQLSSAHEEIPFEYPHHYKEKEMDLFNNQIGRNIGSESFFMLMMKVKFALDKG
ncbi:hypothetical protein pgond44_05680 [Psychroflexus gondwanensis ACAM 44]|uniref:DUF6973 domain-containing protein n=1 Tax=Psychroflexus gondwanensis ACAM 44 TaxID=1189619 RepID=N1WY39_9FLAO|nr:hypothetical protein [Psychroflexus gondwanensis]EMY82004.1 hypothetical protein pgond44_05680 [Psychroflexus gondwanensis ACAM 44]